MAGVDPKIYPRLAAYLGRLRGDLSACPTCQIRADFAAIVQAEHRALWAEPTLPPHMRAVLSRPWQADEWLPVVVVSAQALIVQDRLGLTDAQMVAASLAHTATMLDAPVNRAIVRVMSPYVLLMGLSWRWSSFHRGVALTSLGGDRCSQLLKITCPPHLLTPLAIAYYGALFVAFIERTRGTQVEMQRTEVGPGELHYALKWQMPA